MTELALDYAHLSDVELATLVAQRDPHAVRIITGRNNQRLFRAAWSILRDRSEAEDAVQDAYLKGFAAMAKFAGTSSISTWLTRIVINEALEKKRTAERRRQLLAEQRELDPEIRDALHDTFPFAGRDCDAMTERVLQKFLQDPT